MIYGWDDHYYISSKILISENSDISNTEDLYLILKKTNLEYAGENVSFSVVHKENSGVFLLMKRLV